MTNSPRPAASDLIATPTNPFEPAPYVLRIVRTLPGVAASSAVEMGVESPAAAHRMLVWLDAEDASITGYLRTAAGEWAGSGVCGHGNGAASDWSRDV